MILERTSLEAFERIYAEHPDPWGYDSSTYEQSKYERTLAVLGRRRYDRALEVGCSIGVFTARLVNCCGAVVALEPAATALARARGRLEGCASVEFRQAAIPEGLPSGAFDLVICSEVLYYLSSPLLIKTLAQIERQIAPGGVLVAVHFRRTPRGGAGARLLARALRRRGPAPGAPLSGDAVHELLRTHTQLKLTHEEYHADYRLDRFDRLA